MKSINITERNVDSRGDRFVGKAQIAEVFGVSNRTVENWMKWGRIPYLKIGGVVRFEVGDVREAMKRFKVRGF